MNEEDGKTIDEIRAELIVKLPQDPDRREARMMLLESYLDGVRECRYFDALIKAREQGLPDPPSYYSSSYLY